MAAANLLALGMDLQQSAPGDDGADQESYETDPAPTSFELVRSAFRDHFRHAAEIPSTIGYTVAGINRVRRSSRARKLGPTRPCRSRRRGFMNQHATPERRFATASLSLDDIKKPRTPSGCRSNDLVLAMSAGALRKASLRYDGHADHPLLASVPVSFDFSSERISGNRFTGVMMPVHHRPADPLDRVRRTHEDAVLARRPIC